MEISKQSANIRKVLQSDLELYIAKFTSAVEGLREAAQEIIENCQMTQSLGPSMNLDGESEWLLILRDARDEIDSLRKEINKAITFANIHFAQSIVDERKNPSGDTVLRNRFGTFSASAKTYFTVVDIEAFYAHLEERHTSARAKLLQVLQSKGNLDNYCTEVLASGCPEPPGTKYHIEPTISIRRKK